jgi:hypothetical protein
MEARLQSRLEALAQLLRRARLCRALAISWAAAAAAGLVLFVIQILSGREFHKNVWIVPPILGIIMAGIVLRRRRAGDHEILDLIREMESDRPEVRHLISTAAEQKADEESVAFGFLQLRVIEEALAHPRRDAWLQQLRQRLAFAQTAQAGALLALLVVVLVLHRGATRGAAIFESLIAKGITVTPGDTQVERGTALVIAARFGGTPPAEATLVLNSETGKELRMPMARQLADPIFGASIPEVSEAGVYHIDYGGKKTRDFKITVFEFPALVRADAELRYPAYTGLTNRTIRDALRVSAVTGSHLGYTLQLNKPVVRARLAGAAQSLTLAAQSNAVAVLPEFVLANSGRYALELVDAEGRSNKFATEFVMQALTNQRPEVRLVFPRGDPRVSRLEELQLQAEASDDFGLLRYGFGFGVAGQEPQIIERGQSAPANARRQFDYLVPLEKLGVEADQAVAYFAWADDYGPDGQARRTFSDMFFAEVRPFDEIFRPDQSGGSENGSQSGSQGGGNERVRLAELQKQIVVATWNLQRQKTGADGAQHP